MLENYYSAPIIASMASWIIAQIIKTLLYISQNRKLSVERFWGAGGMPSSHSAAVCALAAGIGKTEGVTSAVFAVAMLLALVVMYDASGVRRAAGLHAREINRMRAIVNRLDAEIDENSENESKTETAAENKSKRKNRKNKKDLEDTVKQLKEFLGHSPVEVLAGAVLGAAMGIFVPVL